MPHAVADMIPEPRSYQKSRTKPSRETRQLSETLEDVQATYEQSQFSKAVARQLQASLNSSGSRITRILSLGLGSLFVTNGQRRRLKQLTILLAIRDHASRILGQMVEIYAQDPTFTRADESFLAGFGIRILRTPSGSELGEAAKVISQSTIIYSPFLTIEVYAELLLRSGLPIPLIFGDDFNALLKKWPRHSGEQKQVERVMKSGLGKYRRKAVNGDGFWNDEDATFPMALYQDTSVGEARVKAKI